MKLLYLGDNVVYPYRLDIDRDNKNKIEDVNYWIKNHGIECTLIPGLAFFKKEKDAVWFMLRWL